MIDGRNNETHRMTIPLDVKFDDEFLENVLITCFEGGSNYWIARIPTISNPNGVDKPKDVHVITWIFDALKCGGYVEIDHTDYFNGWKKGDGIDIVRLDMGKLLCGVRKFIEDWRMRNNVIGIFDDDLNLDGGNFDVDMCDMILQYAVFGDVIYG